MINLGVSQLWDGQEARHDAQQPTGMCESANRRNRDKYCSRSIQRLSAPLG